VNSLSYSSSSLYCHLLSLSFFPLHSLSSFLSATYFYFYSLYTVLLQSLIISLSFLLFPAFLLSLLFLIFTTKFSPLFFFNLIYLLPFFSNLHSPFFTLNCIVPYLLKFLHFLFILLFPMCSILYLVLFSLIFFLLSPSPHQSLSLSFYSNLYSSPHFILHYFSYLYCFYWFLLHSLLFLIILFFCLSS